MNDGDFITMDTKMMQNSTPVAKKYSLFLMNIRNGEISMPMDLI